MSHERPVDGKVMFAVYLEGERDLVLRDGAGTEQRRLTLSESTLQMFSAEDVAADFMTSVGYEMKSDEHNEVTRR